MKHHEERNEQRIWGKVCNLVSIPKINIFFWILVKNTLLTTENLRKHGIHGPSRCILCIEQEETSHHIFLECPFTTRVWKLPLGSIGRNFSLPVNIINLISNWKRCYPGRIDRKKALLIFWNIVPKKCLMANLSFQK